MKRIFVTTALVAGLAASGTAFAADPAPRVAPVVPEAMPAYVFTWTGLYAGVNAGYRIGRTDPGGADVNTALGGVQAGYLRQFGNFVAGIEADVGYGSGSGRFAGTRFEQTWEGSLRGKLGVAFDRFMAYGTGGVAVTDLEVRNAFGARDKMLTGWTLGAGAAYALTENVSFFGEYRYSDYGRTGLPGGGKAGIDDHALRFGLNFKF